MTRLRTTGPRRTIQAVAAAALLLAGSIGTAGVAAARPASMSTSTPWVVSLGDSAISGEAGRWAGNTNSDPYRTDALGPTAYNDGPGRAAEQIPGCHRSASAEIYIGGGINGLNLACSGAQTETLTEPDGTFKPGLDFYQDRLGRQGQALMLQHFAATHRVKDVVVLIGANNYQFSTIVQTCVLDWYLTPSWAPRHCQDDPTLTYDMSPLNYAVQTSRITAALRNVHQAMTQAGYRDSDYTILAQTYSTPIPYGSGFRYPETGLTRQTTGGCGTWNADANWVNTTVVPTFNHTIRTAVSWAGLPNVKILDDQSALVGHRLCENTDGLLEEQGVWSWTSPGAPDRTEWVQQIRTSSTLFGPYQMQEDGHPNYWGQLALRNCLRQAYNNGTARSGTCTPTGGIDAQGEPNMALN